MANLNRNTDTEKFLTTSISGFSSVRDRSGQRTTIEDEVERIRRGDFKDVPKIKKPAVTWSGYFKGRSEIIAPSGLMCMDLDKVIDIERSLKNLKKSSYVFAAWISPSGNGIKFLVRIPLVKDAREYKGHYSAALEHFKGFDPDKSTSDINRLCFTSSDPDLYLNLDAVVFTERIDLKPRISKHVKGGKSESELARIAFYSFQKWERETSFEDGNRNNALFKLGCKWGALGIPKELAHEFLLELVDSDFSALEIIHTVDSAYRTIGRKTQLT